MVDRGEAYDINGQNIYGAEIKNRIKGALRPGARPHGWGRIYRAIIVLLLHKKTCKMLVDRGGLYAGRYCDAELQPVVQSGSPGGLTIALVAVVALLLVFVLALVLLVAVARSRRRHTGTYRPSDVQHNAAVSILNRIRQGAAAVRRPVTGNLLSSS